MNWYAQPGLLVSTSTNSWRTTRPFLAAYSRITQGLRDRASDIHIEPQKDYLRIRFRIDGVLQDLAHLPSSTGAA